MSSYTSWYKDGTAGVVNGATAVTGTDTYWSEAGIHPGDLLTFDDGNSFVEIAAVNSDTSITLAKPFTGGTKANASYAIVRNFTAGTLPEVASQVVDALAKYTRYFNEDTATLQGKSAYEVAKDNGFVGTEAQWVESLKAAGEWSTLNDRTQPLAYHNAGAHNSIYRGKDLGGVITAEQLAAIRAGTFNDLYPGDYWRFLINSKSITAKILGLNTFMYRTPNTSGYIDRPHAVVYFYHDWKNPLWSFPVNDTATCQGHIKNSKLYTEHLPAILAQIESVVGAENILSMYDLVADSIDANGNVNHRVGSVEKIFLPSLYNLTGIMSNPENTGWLYAGREKFPLYNFVGSTMLGTAVAYTSENANATQWETLSNQGNVAQLYDANTSHHIYPFILLG